METFVIKFKISSYLYVSEQSCRNKSCRGSEALKFLFPLKNSYCEVFDVMKLKRLKNESIFLLFPNFLLYINLISQKIVENTFLIGFPTYEIVNSTLNIKFLVIFKSNNLQKSFC